ncbi:MAG: exo-alpha-sialidase [Gemmatimonadota bacterium]
MLRPARVGLTLMLAACGGGEPAADGLQLLTPPVGEGSLTPVASALPDGGALLSWLEPAAGSGERGSSTRGGAYRLRMAEWDGRGWSEAQTVAQSEAYFVNWADFPGVVSLEDGTRLAYWLERDSDGSYDYRIRVALWDGAVWSEPWTLHDDESPAEHGFVSMVPAAEGALLAWLDGRHTGGSGHGGAMSLHARLVTGIATMGPDLELDGRTCDCCQTDMAVTDEGVVVVYRDRSPEEIRDIWSVRRGPDGAWSEPRPVHVDGWEIAACPVNGPAVAAQGSTVVVAWFTAPADVRQVNVAFSRDGGRSFAPPLRVDGGDPIGRVDVRMKEDGAALVSWVEDLGNGEAEIRVREVTASGATSEPWVITRTSSARASGFPRLTRFQGGVLVAWTDDALGRVRAAVLPWGEAP